VIAVSFCIGFGVSNSVSADSSPSGTSIPIKKGGTGSTTEQGALQNLLPDFASNTGKVLGSTGTEIGWVEQAKSSDDVGKVKIDNANNTMTTNGEIGVNNGSQVSINRPDLWTAGVEYDFGNNLYGQRFTGTITADPAARQFTVLISDGGIARVVDSGGWFDTNRTNATDGRYFSIGHYAMTTDDTFAGIISSAVYVIQNTQLHMNSRSPVARAASPYDVWVTYTKI
jgi:hypothetical protein